MFDDDREIVALIESATTIVRNEDFSGTEVRTAASNFLTKRFESWTNDYPNESDEDEEDDSEADPADEGTG